MTSDGFAPPRRHPSRDVLVVGILALAGVVAFYVWFDLMPRLRYTDDVAVIEGTFPTLVRIGAREFVADEDCERIVTDRGAFTSGCERWGYSGAASPLDAQACAEIDAILRASEGRGRLLRSADLSFHDGAVREGWFGLDAEADHADYRYQPGYGMLPDLDSQRATAVNDDWFVVTCCD